MEADIIWLTLGVCFKFAGFGPGICEAMSLLSQQLETDYQPLIIYSVTLQLLAPHCMDHPFACFWVLGYVQFQFLLADYLENSSYAIMSRGLAILGFFSKP